MTSPTLVSQAAPLTFDEVLRRLMQHEVVDGLIVIGSAARDVLTAASDYDLYLVLSSMPAPLHVGLTWIDGRITDLVLEQTAAVDRFLAQVGSAPVDDGQERLVRYVATGRIVIDRHGRLEQVHQKTGHPSTYEPVSSTGDYQVWFSVNYNLRQTKRMLASTDPVYARAVDIRLLYSTAEVLVAYFQLRHLPWRGEKEAIRYLAAQDPEFWRTFEAYADATTRTGRLHAYERLATLALAPYGGLWPDGVTALQFEGDKDPSVEMVQDALAFWEDLLAI